MKKIRFTIDDGRVYEFPARLVATNRAAYYASKDPDTTYGEEMEYTLNDEYALIDWAVNNMNWEDVEHAALLVHPNSLKDPQDSWVWSDNFEVIDE